MRVNRADNRAHRLTVEVIGIHRLGALRIAIPKAKSIDRIARLNAHVYQPIVSREDVSNSVLRDLQAVLFGDRLPTLMLGLLENGQFSQDDVYALKAALKNVESREESL